MILEKVYDELYGMIEDLKKKINAAEKSDVTITPSLATGLKLADITVDGTTTSIYTQDFKVYKPSLSSTGTIAAGDSVTCGVVFDDFIDEGYTPIFCAPAYSGDAQFAFVQCEIATTGISARIANFSSTPDSGTPTVYVLAVRIIPATLGKTKKKK